MSRRWQSRLEYFRNIIISGHYLRHAIHKDVCTADYTRLLTASRPFHFEDRSWRSTVLIPPKTQVGSVVVHQRVEMPAALSASLHCCCRATFATQTESCVRWHVIAEWKRSIIWSYFTTLNGHVCDATCAGRLFATLAASPICLKTQQQRRWGKCLSVQRQSSLAKPSWFVWRLPVLSGLDVSVLTCSLWNMLTCLP